MPKQHRSWWLSAALALILALALAPGQAVSPIALAQSASFLETFDGTPASPLPWRPEHWATDLRPDQDPRNGEQAMTSGSAHHGENCAFGPSPEIPNPLPAPEHRHTVSGLSGTLFLCNNHLMSYQNGGYVAAYLTPPAMMDFSQGTSSLTWDMSTTRSSDRDWIEILLTPFADNDQISFEEDSQPPYGLRFQMINGQNNTGFRVYRITNNDTTELPANTFLNIPDILRHRQLSVDAARRDPFRIDLSETHVKLWMPDPAHNYDGIFLDTDIPALGPRWNGKAVVQLNHYSYNPEKACDFDGTCAANTWHWDNVAIAPALPFSLDRGDQTIANSQDDTVGVPAAPGNAFLRFAGWGSNMQYSADNGASWLTPELHGRGGSVGFSPDRVEAYWGALPAGTTSVRFRGGNGAYGWGARDITVWSENAQVSPASATPTVLTSPTPPTSTPTSTPTPIATGTATTQSTTSTTPSATATALLTATATPTPTPTPTTGSVGVPCQLDANVLTCVLPE